MNIIGLTASPEPRSNSELAILKKTNIPPKGVQGAALATVIAQGIGGLLSFGCIVSRRSSYRIRMPHLKPSFSIIKDIYRVGLPSMLTEITESVTFILLNNVLSGYGSVAIAAIGVIIRVVDFAFMPIIGIAEGMLPIIGYNFGARSWKRLWGAFKLAALSLTVILVTATVLLEIFAPELIGIFSHEPEMVAMAIPAMRLVIIMLPVIGIVILIVSMFQGLGRGKSVLFLSLARQFVFFVPALFILPRFIGLDGVWLAMPISDFCGLLVAGSWLWREHRKLRKMPGWKDLPVGTG